MFTSSLEVAKFQGASLRSVSGLRGQIKRALSTPPGAFRATFEDAILLKGATWINLGFKFIDYWLMNPDIVFVRTWYPVEPEKFYAPVTNLLLPGEEKLKWRGMRTVGQMRFELGIKAPNNIDSHYKVSPPAVCEINRW